VNQHVCIIRSGGSLEPEYLSFYFSTDEFQKFIMGSQAGATRQALTKTMIENFQVPIADLKEQRLIAAQLRAQMAEVERARAAVQAQLDDAQALVHAIVRESLHQPGKQKFQIHECLAEVTKGIGDQWKDFPVLGATRSGLALAKEGVGKYPWRYKPVTTGTVFYNPMRILLGSIAMVTAEDEPGITSPDYVVMRGIEGRLNPDWFYQWFRSPAGAKFIESLTRGAVRERLLFSRLAPAQIEVPTMENQNRTVEQFRQISKLRKSLETRLAEIERLPAALLRRAFNPQN
ncbi:MAG TPA: restriction endonuclease subunit S, partial [Verrucomicrobiae bacterium]